MRYVAIIFCFLACALIVARSVAENDPHDTGAIAITGEKSELANCNLNIDTFILQYHANESRPAYKSGVCDYAAMSLVGNEGMQNGSIKLIGCEHQITIDCNSYEQNNTD